LGAIGGIILTSLFAKAGKAEGFWGIAAFVMAILCCLAAIACAVKIILIGVNLMQGNGKPGDKDYFAPQTMYGIGLIAAGTMLIVKALEAVSGAGSTPEKPAVAPSGAGAGASGATGAAAGSPLVPATTGPFSAFSGLSNIFQGM
jgi:hypothetical protein